jgi:glycine/sarcosine N-methyltransferase
MHLSTMYDAFSVYYDRFVNWQERLAFEMPFIHQHLSSLAPPGRHIRVLDAATGSGMHVIELARSGFIAYGADLSSEMVRLAQTNTRKAQVKATFKIAGFGGLAREFSKGLPFDAVLCLGNSLPHVASDGELLGAIDDFYQCLRPGGLVIVQNRNFDAVLAQHQRWMDPQACREGDEEWIFLRFYDFEPDRMINFNIITLHRQGQEAWQQQQGSTRLLPVVSHQLDRGLSEIGFSDIRFYGSMSTATPYDKLNSGNLVAVALKPF